MEQIIGFRFHQGVMALAEVPPEPHIGGLPSPHVLVALDSLHHADNVGVIVRNAAGLGVDAVIAGEKSASPYLRRSVRNSMGAVFRLPIFHPPSLEAMLRGLTESRGTRLIAADASGDTSLEEADFSGNICVIVGNEQEGVCDEILPLCSLRVRIAMDRGVDSLNVGSAAAVIFHAIREYRRWPGKPVRP
jgi:tRNA G18 (ribose-2'-O)-methylase SpoU